MSVGFRLTLAGVVVAAVAVVASIAVVPTRLALGAGSIGCGTVLRPDRTGDLSAACERVVADHLRATLTVGAVLAVLALVPVLGGRTFQRSGAAWPPCTSAGSTPTRTSRTCGRSWGWC